MNEGGVVKAAKKPLLPRWLKFLLILVGTFFFLAAGAWVLLDIITRHDLRAAVAELRALGWPTTLEDLERPEIEPAENAAVVYEQAFGIMVNPDRNTQDVIRELRWDPRHFRVDISENDLKLLEAYLAANAQALALLRRAAQIDRCVYPMDYQAYLDSGLPPLYRDIRDAGHLLIASAAYWSHKGDVNAALRDWHAGLALAHTLGDEDLIGTYLIRWSIVGMLVRQLEFMVQRNEMTDGQLTGVLKALETVDVRRNIGWAMRTDFCCWLAALDRPVEVWGPGSSRIPWQRRWAIRAYCHWLARPLRQYDRSLFTKIFAEATTLSEKPYYEVAARVQGLGRRIDDMPPFLLQCRQARISTVNLVTELAHFEARLIIAQTGVAVILYGRRAGEYPDSLEQLVPDIVSALPTDPYDGRPIRYAKGGEAIIGGQLHFNPEYAERVAVYSIGEDLTDDGGSEEWGEGRPEDTIFAVKRGARPVAEEADDE